MSIEGGKCFFFLPFFERQIWTKFCRPDEILWVLSNCPLQSLPPYHNNPPWKHLHAQTLYHGHKGGSLPFILVSQHKRASERALHWLPASPSPVPSAQTTHPGCCYSRAMDQRQPVCSWGSLHPAKTNLTSCGSHCPQPPLPWRLQMANRMYVCVWWGGDQDEVGR